HTSNRLSLPRKLVIIFSFLCCHLKSIIHCPTPLKAV
uniref:Uncharacterized protein n=1 Tax=Triticum urartu TaxID=4572 RepID=A0A8R7PXR6_TRIUA